MRRNGSTDIAGCGTLLAATARVVGARKHWSFERSTRPAEGETIQVEVGRYPGLSCAAHTGVDRGARRWNLLGIYRGSLLLTSAILAALCLATLGRAHTATPASVEPGGTRVELVYASPAALRDALRLHPAVVIRLLTPLKVAEVRPAGNTRAFIRAIGQMPGISAVRPVIGQTAADDPGPTLQPSAMQMGSYEWQYHATGVDRVPTAILSAARTITIAVIDTGADLTAPDLIGHIAGAYDIRSGSRNVTDTNGHGTFVASIAGGSARNGALVAGFGGEARLLIVKAADSAGLTDIDIAAGILYAVRHGSRIINLSFAGQTPSTVEASAVAYAAKRGILLVAAAGNDALAGNPTEYPAAYLQPIGSNGLGGSGLVVAASGNEGKRALFSEFGSFVSLAAPGASVFGAVSARSSTTAYPRSTLGAPGVVGLYGYASGTSFAAPQVSGAAALVWAANPTLSARQVADVLKQTASGRGSWTPGLGFGVIDVAAAVARATDIANPLPQTPLLAAANG